VLKENEKLERFNTKKAYDPKIEEFKEFCNDQFSHNDFRSCVTEEFAFLYYQAFREIRRRGRKRRNNADDYTFDSMDYNRVLHQEENPVGKTSYEVVNQYLCSILKL
jgi:hypothetical protein